jgi:hypothetical protein
MGGVSCSQHQCSVCLGKASSRGGVIFRCWQCPVAFCGDCLPDEFEPLDVRSGDLVEQVKYFASSVEYLICSGCTKGKTRKISRGEAAAAARVLGGAKSAGNKRPKPDSTTAPNKRAKKTPKMGVKVVKPAPVSTGKSVQSGDAQMQNSFYRQGPHVHKRVRRSILDSAGEVMGFKDGTVVGYLPLQEADYISELTGKPAPLWRVAFDDDRTMGQEDLEEVEVEDAIKLHAKSPAKSNSSPYKSVAKSPASAEKAPRDGKEVVRVDSDMESDEAARFLASNALPKHLAQADEGASSSRETPTRPCAAAPELGCAVPKQHGSDLLTAVSALTEPLL